MKKFYYKKDFSVDKTPIILRLERRRTVNVAKEAGQEEQGHLSARSASISGLDQLKYEPSLPRTRPREVTKSLSEDVFCSYRPSGVVITEAELSSSWLYENMKAIANSKDETDKKTATSIAPTPQEQDLTPKVLQDPKMKPIPVPVASRSKKTSSCCCYLAIMIVISLCTIGFLSAIGGILYMEIISNQNVTLDPSDDIVKQHHSAQSQDLEVSTEVVDQTEVYDSLDQDVKPSENDSLNNTEIIQDQQKIVHILDFGKPLGTELSQYIDNTRTEIRLQNGNSIIYEKNLTDSFKYKQNFNDSKSNASKHESSQEDNTERNLFGMSRNFDQSKEIEAKIIDDEIIEVIETDIDLESDSNRNSNLSEKGEKIHLDLNVASNNNVVKEDIEQTKTDVELKSEIFIKSTSDKESSKQTNAGEVHKELNIGKDDSLNITDKIDSKTTDQNINGKLIINYPNDLLMEQNIESLDKSETRLKSVIELLPTDGNLRQEISDKTDEDESMILIIDDEYESHQEDSKQDAFISNRNGDLPVFRVPHSKAKTSTRIKSEGRRSGLSTVDLSQRFRQQVRPGGIQSPKKPMNRLTVAEVMKQLKVIDVNNKLASFRMKSVKPNIKKIKLAPKSIPRKGLPDDLEKKQYLEKLRVMLNERLQ